MENNKYNKDNKEKKPKEPGVNLAFWLLRKAKAEGVSFEQLVVYQWIYQKNKKFEKNNILFGKTSRTKLYECIAQDTGQSATTESARGATCAYWTLSRRCVPRWVSRWRWKRWRRRCSRWWRVRRRGMPIWASSTNSEYGSTTARIRRWCRFR